MADISYKQLIKYRNWEIIGKELRRRAELRDAFLSQNNAQIRAVLINDLERYLTGEDINNIFPITIDEFVPRFLENLIQVHKKPAIFKWQEGEGKVQVSDDEQNLFSDMVDELKFHLMTQDNDLKMRFHNTILIAVRFYQPLDKLYIDNSFNVGTCTVIPYPGFDTEPMIVYRAYKQANGKDRWYVWDARDKTHYFTEEEPKYNEETQQIDSKKYIEIYSEGGKIEIEEVTNATIKPSYFPFVVARYKDQNCGFWQNGMDSIVEINRFINVLFSVMGEDSVRETLRILIFPWEVVGREGKPGEIKTGMRNPIYPPQTGETANKDAQLVSADLYNEQIIQLVEKLSEILSGLQNMNSVFKTDIESALSGIAIRLKNEPILNQWAKDINIVREIDWYILEKAIEVNNFHIANNERDPENKQINPEIMESLILDYQEPGMIFDDTETYKLEQMKWQDGTGSMVEYIQRRNPEWSEENCLAYIEENKGKWEQLNGISKNFKPVEPQKVEDIINK